MVTMPFNSMWTLRFKTRPTNAFFTTVNQMFLGSSRLPSTVKHCLGIVWTVLKDLITCTLSGSQDLGGAAEYLIENSKECI